MTTITKTMQTKRIAAVRHLIKRNFKQGRLLLCNAFRDEAGHQMFCDGYVAVCLNIGAEVEYSETTEMMPFSQHLEREFFDKAFFNRIYKMHITSALCKTVIDSAKLSGVDTPIIVLGPVAFNANYVKDACDILGGDCDMFCSTTQKIPAYIIGELGHAVVMPRIKK